MKRIYLNLFMLFVISLVSCKDDDKAEPAYSKTLLEKLRMNHGPTKMVLWTLVVGSSI
jgi:hypothetical protein